MNTQKIINLISKNLLSEAKIECKNLLYIYPKNADIYYFLGIIFLKEKNFEEAADLFNKSINLNKNKSTLIIGDNGSGKSSILDALTFSLFGKPYRNINKPQLLNSITKKDMVVEIYFNIGKNNPKYSWTAEIKSVPDFKCISPKQINMYISSKNNGFGCPICIQIPRVKQPISLFVVFRALNIISDKDICEYILLDIDQEKYKPMLDILQASIIEANNCLTNEDAIPSYALLPSFMNWLYVKKFFIFS